MNKFPILYHEGKSGAMYSWKIWTEGDTIVTEYGQVDGERQIARKRVKGKNLGRANETTPEEQALSEAASMHQKKLDRKYSTSKTSAVDEKKILPMLAHEYKKNMEFTDFDVQPKLNGVRALAFRDQNGRVVLLSRGGKYYNAQTIQAELEDVLPANTILDGEIYCHGMRFQNICKLIKKWRPEESTKLKFHAYDIVVDNEFDTPWKQRRKNLARFFDEHPKLFYVKEVPTTYVPVAAELQERQAAFLADGYEGTMIRLLDGKYEVGYRSRSLLKYKDFRDAEYKVVGFTDGLGRYEGCVLWVCETKDGKKFTVSPKGTLEEKQEYFRNAKKYIGELLTVKFFDLTDDGIPQFPVGIGFRLKEDL